jgi:hypothetical protein
MARHNTPTFIPSVNAVGVGVGDGVAVAVVVAQCRFSRVRNVDKKSHEAEVVTSEPRRIQVIHGKLIDGRYVFFPFFGELRKDVSQFTASLLFCFG